jgi:heme-degrading monooxygenase HmoA
MKTVLVNYNLPNTPPRAAVMEKFIGAAKNMFSGMDGLLSKQFTYDENTGDGLSVYLWDSAEKAEAFHGESFVTHFKETFGVDPIIEHRDILILVDNRAGDIIENNQ